jgi:hypothetical protein
MILLSTTVAVRSRQVKRHFAGEPGSASYGNFTPDCLDDFPDPFTILWYPVCGIVGDGRAGKAAIRLREYF